jgi:hypothetical protein
MSFSFGILIIVSNPNDWGSAMIQSIIWLVILNFTPVYFYVDLGLLLNPQVADSVH